MTPIIDEQGRVFGRVNIIDAVVILGIAGLIITGYTVVNPTPEPSTIDIIVTYRVDEPAVIANQITIGYETNDARITAVADVNRYEHPDTGEVYKITDVTVRHNGERNLAVGDNASVRFDEIVIDGRVISVKSTEVTS